MGEVFAGVMPGFETAGKFYLGRGDGTGTDVRYHYVEANNSTTDSSNYLSFNVHTGASATSTSQVLRLQGNGRVGINATSPATDMHLLTSGSTAQLRVESGLGNYTQLNANGLSNYSTSMDFDSVSHYIYKVSGSEKMRLTSAGLLGVGTDSPSTKIHASGASSASALRLDESTSGANSYLGYLDTSGNFGIDVNGGGYLRFAVGGAERVRLTSAGNFGIGSQSPTYKLVVSNGGAAGYEFNVNGLNSGVNTVVYNRSTSAYVDSAHFALNYYIYTGSVPAEVLRATSAGEVWIKNTSDQGSYNLQVGGTGVWGAGAYVNGSDKRLKKSIATYTDNAVDLVNKMRPVTFEYVEDYSDDRATQIGFIAQDLQEVLQGKEYLDGVVKDDAEHLNVAYQSLIPVLTKAIQELTARIEALEAA